MPCQYYTPEEERRMAAAAYRKELDRLTHENDMLREALMVAVNGGEVDADFLKTVYKNQVKHRKEDLNRLEKTFRAIIAKGEDIDQAYPFNVYEALGRTLVADPTKPLSEQLDFDPDEF